MYSFGGNDNGQLGHGGLAEELEPKLINKLMEFEIVSVAAGRFHTAVITDAGDLWTFGKGSDFQLGHGSRKDECWPRLVKGLLAVKETKQPVTAVHVAAGAVHTFIVTDEHEVYGFGSNGCGQLGVGDRKPRKVPVKIHLLDGIRPHAPLVQTGQKVAEEEEEEEAVAAALVGGERGEAGNCETKAEEGGGKEQGQDSELEEGVESKAVALPASGTPFHVGGGAATLLIPERYIRPVYDVPKTGIARIECDGFHTVALARDGNVYTFGMAGSNSRLGHRSDKNRHVPTLVRYFINEAMREDLRWVKRLRENVLEWVVSFGRAFFWHFSSLLHDLILTISHLPGTISMPHSHAVQRPALPDPVVLASEQTSKLCLAWSKTKANDINDRAMARLTEAGEALEPRNRLLEFRRVFYELDKDNSGEIDGNEMFSAMQKLGVSMSREQVAEVIKAFDTDNNGTIDEEEYIKYMMTEHKFPKKDFMSVVMSMLRSEVPRVDVTAFTDFVQLFKSGYFACVARPPVCVCR